MLNILRVFNLFGRVEKQCVVYIDMKEFVKSLDVEKKWNIRKVIIIGYKDFFL